MNPDPLVDLNARILSISVDTPTQIVIDRLLRLNNAKNWQEPITIYISPSEDSRSLTILDFLQIHAVLKICRAPIHTVALGMLRGFEVLLLANGTKGHRKILEHSLLCIEPFRFDNLPFADSPIGIGQQQGASLREQAESLLRRELDTVFQELNLDPAVFHRSQIIGSERGISLGIADAVVSIPRIHPQTMPEPGFPPSVLPDHVTKVPNSPEMTQL